MPVEIPGSSIRPADKPGAKICPNCKRKYNRAVPKRKGNRIVLHCPFCGAILPNVDKHLVDEVLS